MSDEPPPPSPTEPAPTSVDLAHVRAAVTAELRRYEAHLSERPVKREQEARAGFVLWCACFIPEAFTPALRVDLHLSNFLAWNEPTCRSELWWRRPALECADFALRATAPQSLRRTISNIDHRSSELREYVVSCIALVAPLLDFSEVAPRVLSSVRQRHVGAADSIALLIATRASPDDRRLWLEALDPAALNTSEREICSGLLANGYAPNPLLPQFTKLNGYAAAVLAARYGVAQASEGPAVGELWARTQSHPLAQPFVSLESGNWGSWLDT